MRTFLLIMILSSLGHTEFSRERGVVTDSNTKLEWQDDYSDNGGDIKRATWSNAIDYCEELNLNGKGWRLPNINELESLVDYSRNGPSIDTIFENIYFAPDPSRSYHYTDPKVKISYTFSDYWSSTSHVNPNLGAWVVYFGYGHLHGDNKLTVNNVRCVRDK